MGILLIYGVVSAVMVWFSGLQCRQAQDEALLYAEFALAGLLMPEAYFEDRRVC